MPAAGAGQWWSPAVQPAPLSHYEERPQPHDSLPGWQILSGWVEGMLHAPALDSYDLPLCLTSRLYRDIWTLSWLTQGYFIFYILANKPREIIIGLYLSTQHMLYAYCYRNPLLSGKNNINLRNSYQNVDIFLHYNGSGQHSLFCWRNTVIIVIFFLLRSSVGLMSPGMLREEIWCYHWFARLTSWGQVNTLAKWRYRYGRCGTIAVRQTAQEA